MTANKKVVAYWKEKAIHVDSVGQAYNEYKCPVCGYITLYPKREFCPKCYTLMRGVSR